MASPSRRAATAVVVALLTALPGHVAAATTPVDGTAPAPAASTTPPFVQEGTPVMGGGRLVQLGDLRLSAFSYAGPLGWVGWESWPQGTAGAPDGVMDTAFVASGGRAGVLRNDGSVVSFDDSAHWMPEPAEGTTLTSLVLNKRYVAFGLQSDGRLITSYPADEQYLPAAEEGVGYTALAAGEDVQYAVRTDGRIVGFAADPAGLACDAAWTPEPGTEYAAISAAGRSWAALRSDGVLVTCGYGPEPGAADVVLPPTGTTFTGVDAGATYLLAARSDGQVTSVGSAPADPVSVPAGRTVVSLSAGAATAAAVLDDGVLLTWGETLAIPAVPEGTGRFLSVAEGEDGRSYAIWDHELITPTIDVVIEPQTRLGRPAHVEVTVDAEGAAPDGFVCVKDLIDGIEINCDRRVEAGRASFELPLFPDGSTQFPGTRSFLVGFAGATTRPVSQTVQTEVLPAALTSVTAELPATLDIPLTPGPRVFTEARVHVETSDGSVPAGWVSVSAVKGEYDSTVPYPHDDIPLGASPIAGSDVTLQVDAPYGTTPGTYPVVVRYTPTGTDAVPATWTGTIDLVEATPLSFEVVPVPRIVGTPQVGQFLRVVPGQWVPEYSDFLYEWKADGELLSSSRRDSIPVDESMLGRQITVTVIGSLPGYLTTESTSAPTAPVGVGTFTTTVPTIEGTARVGETLTAAAGNWIPTPVTVAYTWKVSGRTVQTGSADSYVVPRTAMGKRITVTVTGEGPAMFPGTAVSEPTARVVRPALSTPEHMAE